MESSQSRSSIYRTIRFRDFNAEKGNTFVYISELSIGASRFDKFYINPSLTRTVTNIQAKETTVSDSKCFIIDFLC